MFEPGGPNWAAPSARLRPTRPDRHSLRPLPSHHPPHPSAAILSPPQCIPPPTQQPVNSTARSSGEGNGSSHLPAPEGARRKPSGGICLMTGGAGGERRAERRALCPPWRPRPGAEWRPSVRARAADPGQSVNEWGRQRVKFQLVCSVAWPTSLRRHCPASVARRARYHAHTRSHRPPPSRWPSAAPPETAPAASRSRSPAAEDCISAANQPVPQINCPYRTPEKPVLPLSR